MITERFREEVRKLRAEGWTWNEVAEITGRPKRTCCRAIELEDKTCRHKGCNEPVVSVSGTLCSHHRKLSMRNTPGGGERQKQVMRHMRKHGHLTSEELRNLTGMDAMHLGQVTNRLVKLGMIERPMKGHFCMPRAPEFTPEAPIEPTPDRIGTYRNS